MPSQLASLLRPFSFDGWKIKPTQSCTWAEDNGAARDKAAADFDLAGNHDAAESARAEAVWWRTLPTLDADKLQSIYRTCEFETSDSIDVLLNGAKSSPAALRALIGILFDVLDGVYALAESGDKTAAASIVHLAARGAEIVAGIGWSKPELISSMAEKSFGLPLIVSPNLENQKGNAKLIKSLKVGTAFKLSITPTGKRGRHWKFQDRANGLAVRLVSHIEAQLMFYTIVRVDPRATAPGWLTRAAGLKPFGADTWKEWFAIAWEEVLAESSPNGKPGEHPAFYDKATSICQPRKSRSDYIGKKIASPSIPSDDIKTCLRKAFETIATGKSPRSRQKR